MPLSFLEGSGYLSPAIITGTGNTHTNTTLDTLNFNPQTTGRSGGSLLKGQLLTLGAGGHAPDIIAAVASSTSITLLTATSTTATGTAVKVFNFPVLIGGEASALTNGSAVTSSYWNNTGIITQTHIDSGTQGDLWFQSGGAFTPGAGGFLAGWFLPSFDGGTTFETVVATPSSTVTAVSGRFIAPLPSVPFKVEIQNLSNTTMPSTWAVFLAPWAIQY
jgi:hypothetical protein